MSEARLTQLLQHLTDYRDMLVDIKQREVALALGHLLPGVQLAHKSVAAAMLTIQSANRATDAARAEFDNLVAALGFVIEGRDGRGSAPIYVRQGVTVRVGGYEGWVTSCCKEVGHQHETLHAALAHAMTTGRDV